MEIDDETAITEITIQPDGRIFVFGLSREVAEVLQLICADNHPLRGHALRGHALQDQPRQEANSQPATAPQISERT